MKLFHRIGQGNIVGTILLLVATVQVSLSQTVEKNAEGERIVKYEDGTWRYFEGKDSLLLKDDKGKKADKMPKPIQYDYRLFQRYIAAAVQYESKMLDRVDESSGDVHQLEDQIAALEAENNIAEATRLRGELEVLEARRQDEQRILSHARSLIKRVLKVGKNEKYERLAKISIPEFNPASTETNQQEVAEEVITPIQQFLPVDDEIYTLDEVDEVTNPTSPQVDTANTIAFKTSTEVAPTRELESEKSPAQEVDEIAKEAETSAQSDLAGKTDDKEAATLDEESKDERVVDKAKPIDEPNRDDEELDNREPPVDMQEDLVSPTINDIPDTTSSKDVAVDPQGSIKSDIASDVSKPGNDAENDSTSSIAAVPNPSEVKNSSSETKTSRPAPTYNPYVQDRWFSPTETIAPEYDCDYAYNGIDEITNRQKRELKEEIFFTHTDERLKPYLKDRDYVTCGGYLTSISGGFRYLTLVVRIASRNAVREYGSVRSGSLLNLKLLNGETVSLFSSADHQGLQDPKSGDTLYKVRYPIDYQKEKLLTKSGIDKVRIVWSSGYEDYEVYNVNFFSNQLDCLNGK